MRLLAALILLALTLVLLALMRRGWIKRGERIVVGPLPELPVGQWQNTQSTHGIYVTSTLAGQPYERVVTHGLGLKSAVDVYVEPEGIILQRQGAADLYIPLSDLSGVRTTSGMIGKFAGADSIIVLEWTAGGTALDTGIHVRSHSERQDLLDQINGALVGKASS